jgi:hypothetical protein
MLQCVIPTPLFYDVNTYTHIRIYGRLIQILRR